MGVHREMVAGLVEADVAVVAQAQQLQVDAAQAWAMASSYAAQAASASGFAPSGHVRARRVDVYVVEQVLLHEVAVALVMLRVEAAVLVQVEGGRVGEADPAFGAVLHEVGVQADGGRAGGQAQDAVGLRGKAARDHVGGLPAHVLVRVRNDEVHAVSFLLLSLAFSCFLCRCPRRQGCPRTAARSCVTSRTGPFLMTSW